MKFYALISAMLLSGSIAFAQNDPVLMTVGGNPVRRSAFEDAFSKNCGKENDGDMSLSDFLKAYTDYQLKVKAALDARVDTMADFKQAWARWNGQQENHATFQDGGSLENYQGNLANRERDWCVKGDGGYVKLSHILLRLDQKASAAEQAKLKSKADSLFDVLGKGGDFAELARKYSDDKGSAVNGGKLPWITKGQTVKQFENTAFSLQVGETSQPVLTEFGYEIIRLDDKQESLADPSIKENWHRYLDAKDIRARILTSLPKPEKAEEAGGVEDEKSQKIAHELREGLMVQAITRRQVWARAAEDEKGQAAYFAKNKKKYRWVEPRLEGKRKRKGPRDYKEVQSLVIADYQDKLENDWVKALRHKYPVVVNEEVLATVNKH